jgi:hypothetical protein
VRAKGSGSIRNPRLGSCGAFHQEVPMDSLTAADIMARSEATLDLRRAIFMMRWRVC